MNASKTLIAAIAAATIVGTVGFVSAQTTESNATPAPQDTQQQAPMNAPADMSSPPYVAPDSASTTAPSDAATPSSDSTSMPSTAPSGDVNTPAEPAPKADRN